MCVLATEIFLKENNILIMHSPITVSVLDGFAISRSAAISTDSFMISRSCSKLEEIAQKRTICFWEILSIEDIIV